MSYQVLERDEHGYATHTIENGVEDWIVNYYTPEGKFKDLLIIHLRVPPDYRSEWTSTVWQNGYDYYTKYNDNGELIAEYDTNRANNSFYLNWVYSNLHIVGVNKVQGLTYQEYKDWCKEIGVKVDETTNS